MKYSTIEKSVEEIKDMVQLHGRVCFRDGNLLLPWSANGFTLRFVGNAIAVEVKPFVSNDEYHAAVAMKMTLDGREMKALICGAADHVYAGGFEDGEHILVFEKIGESQETVEVEKIKINGKEPKILPYSENCTMKIEFVGDSITCGYGVWGVNDRYTAYEQDVTGAYAYKTGKNLGAQMRIVSWSGKGFCKTCSGEEIHRFAEFFRYKTRNEADGEQDFTEWQPDVLVINGGTNDASANVADDEFEVKVREFYNFVRGVYPNAEIIFFYGCMGLRYDAVFNKVISSLSVTDGKLHYITTEPIYAYEEEVGPVGHPNYIADERFADELTKKIKSIIGSKC